VGIGGLGQAAVTHYRSSSSSRTRILTVEPEDAAALHVSLKAEKRVNVETSENGTIVTSLNYGNVAEKAWEVLKDGLDASTVVSDEEVKTALEKWRGDGVEVGPCGGAVLAGLKKVLGRNEEILGLSEQSVVVLIGTDSS
jgi:diaminopropionate ammonia-lyase